MCMQPWSCARCYPDGGSGKTKPGTTYSRGEGSRLASTMDEHRTDSTFQTLPPPKYIHPSLPRLFKSTPYATFVNAYPKQRVQLRIIVETEQQLFTTVSGRTLILTSDPLISVAFRNKILGLLTKLLSMHRVGRFGSLPGHILPYTYPTSVNP